MKNANARFSMAELQRTKCADRNPQLFEKLKDKRPAQAQQRTSPQKEWLSDNLAWWCNGRSLQLIPEYPFHPTRKWKFDFYIPALNIAIEYEGIYSQKSRHTTQKGFSGDCEKYNAAAKMGIVVYRYTALNYKSVIEDLIHSITQNNTK